MVSDDLLRNTSPLSFPQCIFFLFRGIVRCYYLLDPIQSMAGTISDTAEKNVEISLRQGFSPAFAKKYLIIDKEIAVKKTEFFQ